MHVLYLFAGVERKADVRNYLVELAKRDNFCLKGLQLDILRNEGHDLHRDDVWRWVSQQLQSGMVDLFLVAPPCNTHSRVRCQYRQYGGPRPLRDFNFPHGYPWLSNDNKQKVQLADDLVQKSFHGCALTRDHGGHFFLEHPEQLGFTAGQIPASSWDLPEAAELLCQKGVRTFAIFQCEFSAPSSKPTRFMTTLDPLEVGYHGLYQLDAQGRYLGPLPKQCPHGANAHKTLVGKDQDGNWKTAPSATYPPELCKWIASIAWPALLRLRGGKAKPCVLRFNKRRLRGPKANPCVLRFNKGPKANPCVLRFNKRRLRGPKA